MQSLGAPLVRSLLGQIGSWVPTTHWNQDLYDRIPALLGDVDVLYSSTVVSVNRTADEGVTLLVQTAVDGQSETTHTLIRAKRLLVLFTPTAENLAPLNLNAAEQNVFAAWTGSSERFIGIATHPALPINGSV
jgi:hypothetical protein